MANYLLSLILESRPCSEDKIKPGSLTPSGHFANSRYFRPVRRKEIRARRVGRRVRIRLPPSGESSTNRSSPADCLRSHKFCRRRQSRGASSSGLAVRGFPLRRTQRCEPPAIEAQVILSLPEIFPFTGAYPAGLFISDHGGNRQPDITVPIIAPFRCGYTSPAHCGAKAHGYSLSQGPRTKET